MWFAVTGFPSNSVQPRIQVLHVSGLMQLPLYLYPLQIRFYDCKCGGQHFLLTCNSKRLLQLFEFVKLNSNENLKKKQLEKQHKKTTTCDPQLHHNLLFLSDKDLVPIHSYKQDFLTNLFGHHSVRASLHPRMLMQLELDCNEDSLIQKRDQKTRSRGTLKILNSHYSQLAPTFHSLPYIGCEFSALPAYLSINTHSADFQNSPVEMTADPQPYIYSQSLPKQLEQNLVCNHIYQQVDQTQQKQQTTDRGYIQALFSLVFNRTNKKASNDKNSSSLRQRFLDFVCCLQ